jgi:uncharacterized membrane protein
MFYIIVFSSVSFSRGKYRGNRGYKECTIKEYTFSILTTIFLFSPFFLKKGFYNNIFIMFYIIVFFSVSFSRGKYRGNRGYKECTIKEYTFSILTTIFLFSPFLLKKGFIYYIFIIFYIIVYIIYIYYIHFFFYIYY